PSSSGGGQHAPVGRLLYLGVIKKNPILEKTRFSYRLGADVTIAPSSACPLYDLCKAFRCSTHADNHRDRRKADRFFPFDEPLYDRRRELPRFPRFCHSPVSLIDDEIERTRIAGCRVLDRLPDCEVSTVSGFR